MILRTEQEYKEIYDYEENNQTVLRANYKVKFALCLICAFICMFIAGFILYIAEISPNWNESLVKMIFYLFILLLAIIAILVFSCVTAFISAYCIRNLNEDVIHKTTYKGGFMLRKPPYVKRGDSVEWIWLCTGFIKLYLTRYVERKVE